VQIEWVQLVDFRSYRSLSFAPSSALNVLTGANGQGKTNLLESIGVLLAGRSFRGARLGEMVRWDQTAATLAGDVSRGEVTRTLRRRIETRDDGRWALDGEGCSWVRAVAFGWQDLAVVSGPPQARRNFLDGFAAKVFPAHGRAWARYRQVLARRNHLLQVGMGERELSTRLEPWNEQLAQLAVEVRARRAQAVEALRPEFARLHGDLTAGAPVGISCQAAAGAVGVEVAAVRALLVSRLRDEVRRGQTLEGPHRDEVELSVGDRDARSFASRGQQRALALALRLAEARAVARAVGSPPVLLLDDALSELDPQTQERAAQQIAGAGQVFLTTVERDIPVGSATWWDVRGGSVTQRLGRIRGAA
jgi:DNA replication and repair protein RecF